jgi:hypothetical protein
MADPVIVAQHKRATKMPDNYSYSTKVERLDDGRFRAVARPYNVTAEAATQDEVLRAVGDGVYAKVVKGEF